MAAKSRSASGNALLALSGQWGKYALQLAALVVFSRLLSPADFGLVAMVTAVVGIAYVIGDFGLSLAALQAQELDRHQRSNLFWWNAVIGLAVAGLVSAAALPLAALYDDPRVTAITLVLSSVFLLNGLGVQFRTELNRALRFNVIAAADVIGQAAGFAAALVAAFAGWSYWALVLMQVVAALITNVIVVVGARWWPGRYRRGTPMRSLLVFGANTFFTQVVNYISTNIDQVLIGRVGGAATLGFYNRAFQIARVPAQQVAAPLTRVMLPYLARRLDDRSAYLSAVSRAQLALATLLLSLLAFVTGTGDWLVPVALGAGWETTVPILRALCLAGALQAIGYVSYWVLLSQGRTGLLFVSEFGARVVMVALMFAVVGYGPVWVALAGAVGQLLILVAALTFALSRAGVPSGPVFLPAVRPALLFGAAGAAAYTVGHLLPATSPDLLSLLTAAVVFAAVCALALVFPAYRRDLRSLRALAGSIRAPKARS